MKTKSRNKYLQITRWTEISGSEILVPTLGAAVILLRTGWKSAGPEFPQILYLPWPELQEGSLQQVPGTGYHIRNLDTEGKDAPDPGRNPEVLITQEQRHPNLDLVPENPQRIRLRSARVRRERQISLQAQGQGNRPGLVQNDVCTVRVRPFLGKTGFPHETLVHLPFQIPGYTLLQISKGIPHALQAAQDRGVLL